MSLAAVPTAGEHPSDYCGPCKSGEHAKCYAPCLCRDRGHRCLTIDPPTDLRVALAERTAERDEIDGILEQIDDLLPIRDDNPRGRHEVFEDLREELAKRDALAATVERLIREAGAIRLDERQRAKAEHDSLADEGRARCERRCEELEDTIARMRKIIDDADRVKDENETLRREVAASRAELKALHDVLSGKRGPT